MASSAAFSINGTTRQQIASGLSRVAVNNLGPYMIFLGGSGVTDNNGLRIDAYQTLQVPIGLASLESLYCVADSAAGANTSDVRVLSYLG